MNLPAGARLAYIVGREAWYDAANRETNPYPYIAVLAQNAAAATKYHSACIWGFEVEEVDLNEPSLRLKVFDDAFRAYVEAPELFAALAARRPTTLTAFRQILDDLGAVDITPRER